MKATAFYQERLKNGLSVVIETMPDVTSAAVGFLVRTGTRDETPEMAGVSHFLEHMCFKGTRRRDWRQINIEFDEMGSTYNAFTSKEKTFYFGWVRAEDFERQTELLADMMASVIPPDEFEMERKVILEEIAMSNDQMDRHLYDTLHEKIFPDHPLSWPVLGTEQTIGAMTRDQLAGYHRERYNPSNLVLIVAGDVSSPRVMSAARQLCGAWPEGSSRSQRTKATMKLEGQCALPMDRFKQQAVALSFACPGATDEDDETAEAVAAVLGGPNSRFFWNIVQLGIAPVASVQRVDYCDTGVMLAYAFGEPGNAERMVEALREEMERLSNEGVSEEELRRVRNRRRTALATEAEAPYHRLMQLAHDVDMFGRPRTVEERLAAVEAVTTERVAKYLKRWPLTGDQYLVSVGPRAWPKT
jgi:predicted Zn-dependent peptidase